MTPFVSDGFGVSVYNSSAYCLRRGMKQSLTAGYPDRIPGFLSEMEKNTRISLSIQILPAAAPER